MNTIRQLTKDCDREDCSVIEGGTMSTCMGFQATYDKGGKRTDAGDPNWTYTSYRCSSCGRDWDTATQYGKTTINEHKK